MDQTINKTYKYTCNLHLNLLLPNFLEYLQFAFGLSIGLVWESSFQKSKVQNVYIDTCIFVKQKK